MRFYTYDPVGPVYTGPYTEGQRYSRVDTGGEVVCQGQAVPEWGLYLAIEDDRDCATVTGVGLADYYARSKVLSFEGTVGQASGRVRETVQCAQIPIEELYALKAQEIDDQDTRVRYNTADTALAVNWWIVMTPRAQQENIWIATGSNSREIRSQSWPTGPNAPVIAIYNVNTQQIRREAIPNQATWDTLELEIAQHLQATSNATKASGDALDAAYADGAGDWAAVATHDPADPAWGYPPTVEISA